MGGLAIFGHSQVESMEIQGFLNAKPASGSANGFKTAKYIQYTSIYKATNFDDAHTECAKVGATLMPIGKLRYFKPTFENIKDVAWKEYGWFRICARKTATGWEEKHPNGTFIPLVSSNFPNVNNTIGTPGSSLVWHPAYPNDLYIVKDSISASGNYWLMPLCYKPKPEIQVCETTKQSCCDNGDCINGQCSCYAGFWAPKNCCCKEFSKYTLFEKSNFFLTIFLVKSKLSTAKKSKTTTFSRVFHPKKITFFLVKSKLSTAEKSKTITFSRVFHQRKVENFL